MPYELLNSGQVTPHRLLALLRLVADRGTASADEILDLLQPRALVENQSAADNVLDAARQCGLVEEDAAHMLQLLIAPSQVETAAGFRLCMQSRVLGVRDDLRPNYLFNLFSAWYIVQNERVLTFSRMEFETRFNEQLFPRGNERQFNTTKFSSWLQWAAYLGLGWLMRLPTVRADMLMPDASVRLRPLLPKLLPEGGHTVPFGAFARALSEQCPELDGGLLFERSWQACYPGEPRGNRLSVALSTALRVLHDGGDVRLMTQADAGESWRLAPAQGYTDWTVTHIRRGGDTREAGHI